MKKLAGILLVSAVVFSAAACTKGDKVKETTLYIEENGKVTEAIVESQDEGAAISEKELTKWVNDEVAEFNKESGGEALEVKKCEVADGTARVTIAYASLKDYGAFNNVAAFEGTAAEARKAGYDLAGEFISAKGKPSITYIQLEGSKEYHVIIVEEPQTVMLDEEILYASPNVKVKGSQAVVDAGTKELAYIIYKP